MSILPSQTIDLSTIIENTSQSEKLPLFREYAWDFSENKFILENGEPKILEGLEAVKVWAYKALATSRYRFMAYSWNYGSELEKLVGQNNTKSLIQTEAQRFIEEALMISPYITGITNVSASSAGKKLSISFTLNTVYGESDMSV